MNEEAKKTPAPGNDGELASKLASLETQVTELAALRKRRSMVTLVGIILLILIIGLFISNIVNFAKKYPTDELAVELQKNMVQIAQSQDVKDLTQELTEEVLPAFKKAVADKFKDEMPKLRAQALQATQNLAGHFENEMKVKLTSLLAEALGSLEKEIINRYPNISTRRVETVIKAAQIQFINELSDLMDARLKRSYNDLASLKESLDILKKDPMYNNLRKDSVGEVENDLIEAMLEICIYNINEKKGAVPANPANPEPEVVVVEKIVEVEKIIEVPAPKPKPAKKPVQKKAAVKKGGAK